jgi:hypothetical protein
MKTALTAIFMLISISAFAGEGANSGGGGQVVVCPDGKGDLTVESLDLWEAKKHVNPYLDLKPNYSDAPVTEQIDLGIERLAGAFEITESKNPSSGFNPTQLMRLVTRAFVSQRNRKPGYFNPVLNPLRGGEMPLTPDAYEVLRPSSPCKIMQAITFDDAGEIAHIQMDLIDRMTNTDLAALYLHEAFYKVLRAFSYEQSSLRVRRAIGYVISGFKFSPISKQIPGDRVECSTRTGSTLIYIYNLGTNQYGMSALSLAGVRTIGHSPPENTMTARSLQDFFDTWLSPDGIRPFNLSERSWRSPVDYDMNYSLEVKTIGDRRHVFAHLNTSPGKSRQGSVEELNCRVILSSSTVNLNLR